MSNFVRSWVRTESDISIDPKNLNLSQSRIQSVRSIVHRIGTPLTYHVLDRKFGDGFVSLNDLLRETLDK